MKRPCRGNGLYVRNDGANVVWKGTAKTEVTVGKSQAGRNCRTYQGQAMVL